MQYCCRSIQTLHIKYFHCCNFTPSHSVARGTSPPDPRLCHHRLTFPLIYLRPHSPGCNALCSCCCHQLDRLPTWAVLYSKVSVTPVAVNSTAISPSTPLPIPNTSVVLPAASLQPSYLIVLSWAYLVHRVMTPQTGDFQPGYLGVREKKNRIMVGKDTYVNSYSLQLQHTYTFQIIATIFITNILLL